LKIVDEKIAHKTLNNCVPMMRKMMKKNGARNVKVYCMFEFVFDFVKDRTFIFIKLNFILNNITTNKYIVV